MTLQELLSKSAFSMTLSSGYFGFFAHAGFAAAVWEAGLRPVEITGSSSGALIAAALASGMQTDELKQRLLTLTRDDFWDPDVSPGLLSGLLQGDRLRNYLEQTFKHQTFEQCPIPLSVSVFSLRHLRTEVINSGELVEAIMASCAYPGLFRPVLINKRAYLDGGILDKTGLRGNCARYPVLYHHLGNRSKWRTILKMPVKFPHRLSPTAPVYKLGSERVQAVTPFNLKHGLVAWQQSYEQTTVSLQQTLHPKSFTGG